MGRIDGTVRKNGWINSSLWGFAPHLSALSSWGSRSSDGWV